MLVGLFVWVWIARYLGPGKFGSLSFATAYIAIFGILATLGMNRVIVRKLVNNPLQHDIILGTAFGLRVLAGVVVFSGVYLSTLLAGNIAPNVSVLIAIIGAGIIFQSLDTIELLYQAKVKSKYGIIPKGFVSFAMALYKIYLITHQGTLEDFAWAILLETFLSALGLLFSYKLTCTNISRWKFDATLSKSFIKECWPEILAGFSTILLMRIDQIMLGILSGPASVGIYTAASRLSEAIYFIPTAIVSSTFPAIIKSRKKDTKKYYARLQRLFTSLVAFYYPVAIITTLFASYIIFILYSTEYSGASNVLIIHIWTGIAVSLGVASGSWIVAEKRLKLNLIRTLVAAAVNITLNYLLIPAFGPSGAAYATLISLTVAFIVFDIFSRPMRKIFWMKMNALRLSGILFRNV